MGSTRVNTRPKQIPDITTLCVQGSPIAAALLGKNHGFQSGGTQFQLSGAAERQHKLT